MLRPFSPVRFGETAPQTSYYKKVPIRPMVEKLKACSRLAQQFGFSHISVCSGTANALVYNNNGKTIPVRDIDVMVHHAPINTQDAGAIESLKKRAKDYFNAAAKALTSLDERTYLVTSKSNLGNEDKEVFATAVLFPVNPYRKPGRQKVETMPDIDMFVWASPQRKFNMGSHTYQHQWSIPIRTNTNWHTLANLPKTPLKQLHEDGILEVADGDPLDGKLHVPSREALSRQEPLTLFYKLAIMHGKTGAPFGEPTKTWITQDLYPRLQKLQPNTKHQTHTLRQFIRCSLDPHAPKVYDFIHEARILPQVFPYISDEQAKAICEKAALIAAIPRLTEQERFNRLIDVVATAVPKEEKIRFQQLIQGVSDSVHLPLKIPQALAS